MTRSAILLLSACLLPTAAGAAALRLVSQPGVEVVWEGVSLGLTDEAGEMSVEGIPEGIYSLELRRAGFEPVALEVQMGPGLNTLLLRLDPLAPQPPEPRPPTRSPPTAAAAPLELWPAAPGPLEPSPLEPPARRPPTAAEPSPGPASVPVQEAPAAAAATGEPPPPSLLPAVSPSREQPEPPASPAPWLLSLLALTALGVMAALRHRARRPGAEPLPPLALTSLTDRAFGGDVETVSEEADVADAQEEGAFLHDLRRREEVLEEADYGRVIEVEVVEVKELNDEERR